MISVFACFFNLELFLVEYFIFKKEEPRVEDEIRF